MTLSEKQRLFCKLIAQLITWSFQNGYEFTFGEAQRSQAQADANAASGAGIKKSNHLIRLAVDLNLFINGQYRTDSVSYKPIGDYWKSLSMPEKGINCCWGGDFSKPDGNHFSFEHEGIR